MWREKEKSLMLSLIPFCCTGRGKMRETAFSLSSWLKGERANTGERRTSKVRERKSVRGARESKWGARESKKKREIIQARK